MRQALRQGSRPGMNSLTRKQETVVLLREEGLTFFSISRRLKISVQAAKGLAQRARINEETYGNMNEGGAA